ncbi:MAG TPA: VOC family protein [Candidatus Methylomirabilis sp.]|nr:VOC family protein [Candidatus Methylomirabilis sp.]
MPRIVACRSVLAVRDLKVSTDFFMRVLGFRRDPIDAAGWSFLSRDGFRVMIGECPDEKPAGDLGDHSYFVHLMVEEVDRFHGEIAARGAEIIAGLADKPWGLREFAIRTPDGHRIVFAEPNDAAPAPVEGAPR